MFEAKQNESFPKKEEKILDFWNEKEIFKKSLEKTKDNEYFSFFDGPPFATGLPHYGHLLAGMIKDVIPRYKTMKGYFVPRRFGWDCHGLPVENEIEKAKKLYGAKAIEEYGIDKFNEDCACIVFRYTEEWKKTVLRMGRWIDFENTYKTMDKSYMESIWWVFKKLYEKGLIYEGFKVMPFSAQLGTPLSNFEANSNYKEVDDPSLTITFPIDGLENTYFLAWTTTPWTLVSNLALVVGDDVDYVMIEEKKSNKRYVLAKARLKTYFKNEDDYIILKSYKGKDFEGWTYQPLFNYFIDRKKDGAYRVLVDDTFVTTEEGTGIVHTAPAFGEDDFYICKKANIDIVCPIDSNGHFTDSIFEFKNLYVKDADKPIIKALKERNRVFSHGQIRHRYPFCWRSDTPLIYKAVCTWFVKVEALKEQLIDANKTIHWVPEHLKMGRFGKWLENARDWAISRSRYWGTPIPIWRNDEGDIHVIGSIEELEERTKKTIHDIHRDKIDDLTFEIDGKTFRRINDVFDCWFESGSMPYAQNHYPFENLKFTEKTFPADFIAEGLDQTRGWFYTLNVLSVALFNKPAYKNVVVNGIILAEDGSKMSKRLKNYPDPNEMLDKYGADAIRLYMLHSPAVKAEDLKFCTKGVELTLRQVLIPLWNAFYFLSTYAKIYHWQPKEKLFPKADIDKWILSLSQKLINDVEEGMDDYDLSKSVEPFVGFIDQLTNWYIRRCRSRFWSDEHTQDRDDAFFTLYTVLLTLVKVTAPFIPFISETIYQQLKTDKMPISLHLCDFPKIDNSYRNINLEQEMHYVQRAVSIGHALRKEKKIKVRQPLKCAHIVTADKNVLKYIEKQKELIQDELNVKDIIFHSDETHFIEKLIKPNFPTLGKKVGKILPLIQKKLLSLSPQEIKKFEEEKEFLISIQENEIKLLLEDVVIERKVKQDLSAINDQDIALALDTKLSQELIQEGLAREIVNKINTMRRDERLNVTDRIHVTFDTTKAVEESFNIHKDYITKEVLAIKVVFGPTTQGVEWDLNGERAKIKITRMTTD